MNITSKYRSLSVQAKAALWFTICSFLQKGISFITVPIFTRLMSTEEYCWDQMAELRQGDVSCHEQQDE